MISLQKLLAIATIIAQVMAASSSTSSAKPKTSTISSAKPKTSTSSASKSCPTAFDANYDDITVPIGSSANVPTPYRDLNYIGWTVAAIVDVAGVPVSTLQTSSPPNTIFFNGNDDTRVHSFSIANGVKYFNLTSVQIGCAIVVAAGTPVGTGNVPTGCTVQAVGTTLSGSMVSTDLIFAASINHALFTFPLSFSKLKTVNFVLTSTSATSGLTAVDFDDLKYTVSTC